MIYFLVALFATTIGAVSGIGGGLIIRPSLSLMGIGLGVATFTSAACVFVMSFVTATTRRVWKTDVPFKHLVFLAIGAIVGAFAGAYTLIFLDSITVAILFIASMVINIIMLRLRETVQSRTVTNPALGLGVGFATGFLAGLFGIGGGLVQMVALMYLYGSKPKDAVVQSLFIAMMSSGAALIQYTINGFADLSLLPYVIPGAILGGLIGGVIAKRMQDKTVTTLLYILMIVVIMSQIIYIATH